MFNLKNLSGVLIGLGVVSLLMTEAPPVVGQTATYYHSSLAGRVKANGRRYNPNGMTAASNNYRLGQRLKVTNRKTGKSVVVTITDRCGNCSIDLSRAAFQRIAPLRQGRVPVRITKL
jgi:rare lipoprotein A